MTRQVQIKGVLKYYNEFEIKFLKDRVKSNCTFKL